MNIGGVYHTRSYLRRRDPIYGDLLTLPLDNSRIFEVGNLAHQRLDNLEKLRSVTYDRINEAVHKSALYADERRRVANKLKVGELARLNLSKGIEVNKPNTSRTITLKEGVVAKSTRSPTDALIGIRFFPVFP
eukprot:SAG11_NODE_821_length_7010_cov_9.308783_8_plen_133_part_00